MNKKYRNKKNSYFIYLIILFLSNNLLSNESPTVSLNTYMIFKQCVQQNKEKLLQLENEHQAKLSQKQNE